MNAPNSPKCVNASLWVYHAELSPVEVTELLGVTPTSSNLPGKPPYGQWLLSSLKYVQSDDPYQHINWVLDKISTSDTGIASLHARGFNIRLNCKITSASGETFFVFEPELMSRLSTIGIMLFLEISFRAPQV